MPLPLAHGLVGAAVAVAADRDGARLGWGRIALAVVLANAADFDFLPGLVVGDPHRFHRTVVHSLGAVVAVGVLVALLVRVGWVNPWPLRAGRAGRAVSSAAGTALIVAAIWSTHLLLDCLNADYNEPYGIMALWPLSEAWIHAWSLFPNVDKVADPVGPIAFVASLLTWHNLRTLGVELLLTGPVLALAIWYRRRG